MGVPNVLRHFGEDLWTIWTCSNTTTDPYTVQNFWKNRTNKIADFNALKSSILFVRFLQTSRRPVRPYGSFCVPSGYFRVARNS